MFQQAEPKQLIFSIKTHKTKKQIIFNFILFGIFNHFNIRKLTGHYY
jgi:hypothetical protein